MDAAGWFCYLTTRGIFVGTEFKPFETALGPDGDFGLQMRREGRRNYVDWAVQREHRDGDRIITLANTEPMRVRLFRSAGEWKVSLG